MQYVPSTYTLVGVRSFDLHHAKTFNDRSLSLWSLTAKNGMVRCYYY